MVTLRHQITVHRQQILDSTSKYSFLYVTVLLWCPTWWYLGRISSRIYITSVYIVSLWYFRSKICVVYITDFCDNKTFIVALFYQFPPDFSLSWESKESIYIFMSPPALNKELLNYFNFEFKCHPILCRPTCFSLFLCESL